MYIKPLYIYEFKKLNNKGAATYKRYIITSKVNDLFGNIFFIDKFHSFCLTVEVAEEYFPKYIKVEDFVERFTNSFLDLRKLTYDETIKYINSEASCNYDVVIKDLINKMILYWDDWN